MGYSAVDPPKTIPNSEVKRCNADGSVGFPHVRVGHRQVIRYKSKSHKNRTLVEELGFLFLSKN
ncbi:hypothetical protein CGSHi7P49H1_00365 [Haemophilus influenzae 7P49H1]|nr:hypothetical protein CGSHi7P49H1_00365 [Haemophilus influenzae 7P49H1]